MGGGEVAGTEIAGVTVAGGGGGAGLSMGNVGFLSTGELGSIVKFSVGEYIDIFDIGSCFTGSGESVEPGVGSDFNAYISVVRIGSCS